MRRLRRLGLVVVIACAAFAIAVVRFGNSAERSCVQRATEDGSLEVRLDQLPRTDVRSYQVIVTRHAGEPVSGARVCVTAFRKGMSALAVTDQGREVAPGAYAVQLAFPKGQQWDGRVLVGEPGRRAVTVPLHFDVAGP